MNQRIVILIVLAIVVACLPTMASAKMTALTAVEMDRITAQKATSLVTGGAGLGSNAVFLKFFESPVLAIMAVDSGEQRDITANAVPPMLTIPIAMERNLTGAEAESAALQNYSLVASTISLANPFFGGFLGLGIVPGAFDVKVGDVSVQLTGNINFSFHQ